MVAIFSNKSLLFDDIEVDIKKGEYHKSSFSSPSRAVQSGSYRSDHLIENLSELTISFEISNVDEIGSKGQRAADIFAKIKHELSKKNSYEILTKHFLYKSMVATEFTGENSGVFNGMLTASIKFIEYLEVDVVDVKYQAKNITNEITSKTASNPVDKGVVETQDVLATSSADVSFLKQIFG